MTATTMAPCVIYVLSWAKDSSHVFSAEIQLTATFGVFLVLLVTVYDDDFSSLLRKNLGVVDPALVLL